MYAVISAELQAPRLISSPQRTRGLYLRLDRYTYTASRPALPAAAGFRSIVGFDATGGAGAAVGAAWASADAGIGDGCRCVGKVWGTAGDVGFAPARRGAAGASPSTLMTLLPPALSQALIQSASTHQGAIQAPQHPHFWPSSSNSSSGEQAASRLPGQCCRGCRPCCVRPEWRYGPAEQIQALLPVKLRIRWARRR